MYADVLMRNKFDLIWSTKYSIEWKFWVYMILFKNDNESASLNGDYTEAFYVFMSHWLVFRAYMVGHP